LRTNPRTFRSQQLLNPTPLGTQRLAFSHIKEVEPKDVPKRLFKFMTVDPAGVRKDKRQGDSWGIVVVGVDPYLDDVGASDLYILDMIIEPMSEAEALSRVVDTYIKSGRVLKLGVEKVGLSTMEIHVTNALRAKGRTVTVESGGMVLLKPAGRAKEQRIEASLAWPLNNGKIHVVSTVPTAYKERLRLEMDKFPFWHDDGLDALAYAYDIIKDYRFGQRDFGPHLPEDEQFEQRVVRDKQHNWLVV
jgi:hypothetical protein